jgi:phospholipid/cholesterol/gamma-HCH transport system permease protein
MSVFASPALAPVRGIGDFFALALDTLVAIVKWPFAWRELFAQTWFVARISLFPAMVLSIPFTVASVFTFNIFLIEIGAADFSGVGGSLVANEVGPFVTVLVVAGSGAAAICADLGARTIREELDALRVMGVDPVRALLAPRVVAVTLVSWLTLVTGLPQLGVAMVKATVFGLTAGLIGVYQGTTVKGGPAGVGNAVNQTVVYSFSLLFFINIILTAIGYEVTK